MGNDAGAVFGRTYPKGRRIAPIKCVSVTRELGVALSSVALLMRPAVRGVYPPPMARLRPGGAGGKNGLRVRRGSSARHADDCVREGPGGAVGGASPGITRARQAAVLSIRRQERQHMARVHALTGPAPAVARPVACAMLRAM